MKRIVRGNDFYLSIPVQKVVGGERSDFDLTGSEGIQVSLIGEFRRYVLVHTVSGTSTIVARVEGDQIPCGKYAVEVKGVQGGNDWRTAEVQQLQIVEYNHDADTDLGDVVDGEVVSIEGMTVGAGGTWDIKRNRLLLKY